MYSSVTANLTGKVSAAKIEVQVFTGEGTTSLAVAIELGLSANNSQRTEFIIEVRIGLGPFMRESGQREYYNQGDEATIGIFA